MDTSATLAGDGAVMSPEAVHERGDLAMAGKANPNHTPMRSFRVPDELWEAALKVAAERGETLSGELNRFLARYVKAGLKKDEDKLTRTLRRLAP